MLSKASQRLFSSVLRTKPLRVARTATVGAFRQFGASGHHEEPEQFVSLTFVNLDGEMKTIQAKVGESLMDAAVKHEIEIPAECDGSGAPMTEKFGWGPSCNSCMVYLPEKYLTKVPAMKFDEGNQLQDCFHVTINSRLSCCVEVTPELDGAHIGLPEYPYEFDQYQLPHRPEWVRRNRSEAEAQAVTKHNEWLTEQEKIQDSWEH